MNILNIKFGTYDDLEKYLKDYDYNYTLAESVYFDNINWKMKEDIPYTHLIYCGTHIAFLIELKRDVDSYNVIKITKA